MTPSQRVTFKAAILADASQAANVAAGATGAIADYYNLTNATFFVWQTGVPTQSIYDKITWSNMTPVDAADGTTLWTNRSLACQGKQFNLQTMLQGRDTINASKSNIRSGLQDALTNIPSGASGAVLGAGWLAVQTAMQRNANNVEKVFATGTGTTASPALLAFEGGVTNDDVVQALFNS